MMESIIDLNYDALVEEVSRPELTADELRSVCLKLLKMHMKLRSKFNSINMKITSTEENNRMKSNLLKLYEKDLCMCYEKLQEFQDHKESCTSTFLLLQGYLEKIYRNIERLNRIVKMFDLKDTLYSTHFSFLKDLQQKKQRQCNQDENRPSSRVSEQSSTSLVSSTECEFITDDADLGKLCQSQNGPSSRVSEESSVASLVSSTPCEFITDDADIEIEENEQDMPSSSSMKTAAGKETTTAAEDENEQDMPSSSSKRTAAEIEIMAAVSYSEFNKELSGGNITNSVMHSSKQPSTTHSNLTRDDSVLIHDCLQNNCYTLLHDISTHCVNKCFSKVNKKIILQFLKDSDEYKVISEDEEAQVEGGWPQNQENPFLSDESCNSVFEGFSNGE